MFSRVQSQHRASSRRITPFLFFMNQIFALSLTERFQSMFLEECAKLAEFHPELDDEELLELDELLLELEELDELELLLEEDDELELLELELLELDELVELELVELLDVELLLVELDELELLLPPGGIRLSIAPAYSFELEIVISFVPDAP